MLVTVSVTELFEVLVLVLVLVTELFEVLLEVLVLVLVVLLEVLLEVSVQDQSSSTPNQALFARRKTCEQQNTNKESGK